MPDSVPVGRVLVLGRGWVGTAVAAHLGGEDGPAPAVDPVTMPSLVRRDAEAAEQLGRLVDDGSFVAVINATGLTRGAPEDLEAANTAFPSWLCEVLGEREVRLVHVGSASEYGDPGGDRPLTEDEPARPVGHYATTKARGTDAVLAARARGLDVVVARVFNLVGSPVPPTSPLHEWTEALRALPPGGGAVEVWWPSTCRDFVELPDAAAALADLAAPGARPPLVNVCSGVGLAYGDVVAALATELGVAATVRSLDRPGIEAVVGDPGRLAATIGWHPEMSLQRLARAALGVRNPTPRP
jgi:NDP-hexose 4-ketoreductase